MHNAVKDANRRLSGFVSSLPAPPSLPGLHTCFLVSHNCCPSLVVLSCGLGFQRGFKCLLNKIIKRASPEIGSAWFVKSWAFLAARRSEYASQREEVNPESPRGFPGLRVSAPHQREENRATELMRRDAVITKSCFFPSLRANRVVGAVARGYQQERPLRNPRRKARRTSQPRSKCMTRSRSGPELGGANLRLQKRKKCTAKYPRSE